jgi:lysophospholipase-3
MPDFMLKLTLVFVSAILVNSNPIAKKHEPTTTRYPVILIPGDGGNQLFAKLDKKSSPHFYCYKKTNDYFMLWLNIHQILPFVVDCFVDNIRLNYDNVTRKSYNTPGVDIKVLGFGQTDTVEYLSSTKLSQTVYFGGIVSSLVDQYGYVRGVNVRGAPYDFRKAPNELDDFYADLTSLVEETYFLNNQTKVILVAHSLGNSVTLVSIT